MALWTFSLVVLVIAGLTMAESNWDQDARDHVLKIHNNYRSKEKGACNMNIMTYDMELEAKAKSWAEQCIWAHSFMRGVGENLAYTTATGTEEELITQSTYNWYKEKKDYNLADNKCAPEKVCGHYTQMVWAKTSKIGCYSTRCDFGYFLVCQYTSRGNYVGKRPYEVGCCPCRNSQEKRDGL